MSPPIDPQAARERETKLLLTTAAGLGCFVILCLVAAAIVVGLALVWTLQGSLGPGAALLS